MTNSLNCEMEITFLEYVVIIKHTLAISIMYDGKKKKGRILSPSFLI